MKSSLDHLPERKQRELSRIVEIVHEEFEDALKEGTADFKKKGRILKIILFGSYARGDWVEDLTGKGYRSDYDLLIIVNNRKLTDFALYWHKAATRFPHDRTIKTPVSLIVHSRREVNTALKEGNYFFRDIRRDGIVLYELDDEELVEPKPLSAMDEYRVAYEHFERFQRTQKFLKGAQFYTKEGDPDEAAFLLHQAIEQAYSTLLLTLTSYSPASHNLNHLRTLAEGRDQRLVEIWPKERQRYIAWFNTINEAYVKARYSPHFEISDEALLWLGKRTSELQQLVKTICEEYLDNLRKRL
ncbi:nucleotidyltransferase and HEPN domain-containing protein [Rhizobium jaguaris]|uniref:HEPN domain-containing protein n=1 Tax=Rhizobium jaguaris TaxID=1312183 RepID=A0A387FT47_9HYPH|nr:nucleotidyltransferase and HEPN domain-containing protein [Rhizobium jaguaris]AYG62430.1 HEPN domain-containing protein [Rhizobium jaguaris]